MLRFALPTVAVIFIVLVATAVIRPLFWLAVALIVLAAAVLLVTGVRTRQERAQRFRRH